MATLLDEPKVQSPKRKATTQKPKPHAHIGNDSVMPAQAGIQCA